MPNAAKSGKVAPGRAERVWDCHVHCYPPEVIADPGSWADKHGEGHWKKLVTEGPQGWADPDQLIRAMDAEGVEKVLLQAWYWENPETAALQNAWHAEWVARHPERFMACAAFHPALRDIPGALSMAESWGALAVGECLPQVQSAKGWQHPGWSELFAWTREKDWPLCVHLTEPVGHVYPGRVETSLMEVVRLFELHPDQRWICAHWGGGLPFHFLNPRVRKALNNVWFDTAASPLLYDKRIWRIVCDLVGPEKILFGSDFPLRLYPRRERDPAWQNLLVEFRESGLTPEEQLRVSHGNLASLLDQS